MTSKSTLYKPFSRQHPVKRGVGKFKRFTDNTGKSGYINTETGEVYMDTPNQKKPASYLYCPSFEDAAEVYTQQDYESDAGIDREIDFDPHEWD